MSYTVTRAEMAQILGVALTSLDGFVAEGCPVVKKAGKGVPSEYDAPAVVQWYVQRMTEKAARRADSADLDQLRAEKIKIETKLKELELAKARSEVAPLEQIERAMTHAIISLRQALRVLPQRVEPLLIGETDSVRFKAVLLSEIDQALEALADADLFGDDEEFGGLADE